MSTMALLLSVSATVGSAVCLAWCMRLHYDLYRLLRVADRTQRRQRKLALGLTRATEGVEMLSQCAVATAKRWEQYDRDDRLRDQICATQAMGLMMVDDKVRTLCHRIYGVTDTTSFTLPQEVDLGATS